MVTNHLTNESNAMDGLNGSNVKNGTHDENNAKLTRFRQLMAEKKLSKTSSSPPTSSSSSPATQSSSNRKDESTNAGNNNANNGNNARSWPLESKNDGNVGNARSDRNVASLSPSNSQNTNINVNGWKRVSMDLNEEMEKEFHQSNESKDEGSGANGSVVGKKGASVKNDDGASATQPKLFRSETENASTHRHPTHSTKQPSQNNSTNNTIGNNEDRHPNLGPMRQITKKRQEQRTGAKLQHGKQGSKLGLQYSKKNGDLEEKRQSQNHNAAETNIVEDGNDIEIRKIEDNFKGEESTSVDVIKLVDAFERIDYSADQANDETNSMDERDISAWSTTGNHLNETIFENGSVVSPSKVGIDTESFLCDLTPHPFEVDRGDGGTQEKCSASEVLSFLGSIGKGKITFEEIEYCSGMQQNGSQVAFSPVDEAEKNLSASAEKVKRIEDYMMSRADGLLSPVPKRDEDRVGQIEKEVKWDLADEAETREHSLMTPSKGDNRVHESMEVNVDNTMNESHLISDDEASIAEQSFGSPAALKTETSYKGQHTSLPLDESSDCHIEILGIVTRKDKSSSNNSTNKNSSKKRSPTTASLMERNKTLVKEVRFADQTCVELSQKNVFYKNEICRYKRDLTTANQEITDMRSNYETMLQENAKLKALVQMHQDQKNEADLQIQTLRSQNVHSEEVHRSNINQWEQTYQTHLSNSENQIKCLNERLEQSLATNSSLQSKLDKWESKFHHQDASSQELILTLKERISERDASVAKADSTIRAMQARMDDLQGLCDQRHEDLQRERQERDMVEHDRDSLQFQCDDLHHQLMEFVQSSDSPGDVLMLEDGNGGKRDAAIELKITPVKELSSNADAHLRTPTSNLLARTLRSELKRRHEASERLGETQLELSKLQREISDVKMDLEESKADNALLEEDLEEKSVLASDLKETMNSKDDLISQLESQVQILRLNQEEANNDLRTELEEKNMVIDKLEHSMSSKTQRISELQEEMEEKHALKEKELEAKCALVTELKASLNSKKERISLLEKEIDALSKDRAHDDNALYAKLEEKCAYIEELEDFIDSKDKQISELEDEISDMHHSHDASGRTAQDTIEKLQDNLIVCQEALETTEDELARAREQLIEAEDQLEQMHLKDTKSEEDMLKTNEKMESYELNLNEMSGELERTKEQLTVSNRELKSTKELNRCLSRKIGAQICELDSTKEKLSESVKQNAHAKKKLTYSIDKILQSFEASEDEAKGKLEEYDERISQLSGAIRFIRKCMLESPTSDESDVDGNESRSSSSSSTSSGSQESEKESYEKASYLNAEDESTDETGIGSDIDGEATFDSTHDVKREIKFFEISSPSHGNAQGSVDPNHQNNLIHLHDEILSVNERLATVEKERDDAEDKFHEAIRYLQAFRDEIIKQEGSFEQEKMKIVKECESLQKKLLDVTHKMENYKEMSEEFAEKSNSASVLSKDNEGLRFELNSLRLLLENETSLLKAAKSDAKGYLDDAKAAKSAFDCLQIEYHAKMEEVASLEKDVADLQDDVLLKEELLRECQQTLSTVEREKNKMENALQDLKSTLSEVKLECQSVKTQLNDTTSTLVMKDDMIKLRDDENKRKEVELRELDMLFRRKEDELRSVQHELIEARAQHVESLDLEQELRQGIEKAQASLSSKEELATSLTRETRQLKNEIARLKCDALEKDEKYHSSLLDKDRRIEMLDKACKDRQALFDEQLSSAEKQRDAITTDLEGMIDKLKTEIQSINEAHRESGERAKSIISSKQTHIDALKEELRNQNESQKHLEEDIIEQYEKIDELQKKVDEESQNSEQLKQESKRIANELEIAQKKLSETQQELQSQELEIERMKTRHQDDESTMNAEIQKMSSEREELLAQISALEVSLSSLNVDNKQNVEKLHSMEATLQNSEELKRLHTDGIANLTVENNKLKSKCTKLKAYVKELTTKVGRWKAAYEKELDTNRRLVEKNESVEKENSLLNQENLQLKTEFLEEKYSSDRYKSRIDHIKEVALSPEGTTHLLERPATL